MKYESIDLIGKGQFQYSLVKYEDKYKNILDSMGEIDNNLIDAVKTCPNIYSADSDYQAYMLVKGDDIGVGATYIGASADEKDLEVTLQLDESKFANETEMYVLINQLVDSLKFYCYEKKNVYITLMNKIDLSKYDNLKYKREYLLPNVVTYVCSNKKYNTLIPLLLKEIKSCEDILTSWHQGWRQDVYYDNYLSKASLSLYDYLSRGDVPPTDTVYGFKGINWSIMSNNNIRDITFNADGSIKFCKLSKINFANKYEFNYNLLDNGFCIKSNRMSIIDNDVYTEIKAPNAEMFKLKDKDVKKIIYKSEIVDKSSIYTEVLLNNKNKIKKCSIEFRTHKGNNKINGRYAVIFNPKDEWFDFLYITRKGKKYGRECLYYGDELTLLSLENRIESFKDIINTYYAKERHIAATINIGDIERDAINFMKEIEGEIPLPYLKDQIDKLILEYGNSKNNDKVKKLQ